LEDVITKVAIVGEYDYCNVPRGQRTDIGMISTSKNWQPAQGTIEFAAKTFAPITADVAIRACFRWSFMTPHLFFNPYSESANNRILDRQSGTSTLKLEVTVPVIAEEPDRMWWKERAGNFGIPHLMMPKVDVRVLLFNSDLDPVLDARGAAWVTNPLFGLAAGGSVAAAGFLTLWVGCRRRFTRGINPLLCVITTREGYASLSQFQIMLWTFLVIGSAAYVLALSGTLVPITSGTLILLGISGVTAVISRVKSNIDAGAAPAPPDTATAKLEAARAEEEAARAEAILRRAHGNMKAEADMAAKDAAARARAAKAKVEAAEATLAAANARAIIATALDKAKAEGDAKRLEAEAETKRQAAEDASADAVRIGYVRRPLWSDLITGEKNAGQGIDMTRVQMLFFTFVTAVFVATKILTSYEIPEIPEGYLILMGISNSVYLGARLTTNPMAKE
jgi:hypothetical protein